jgi:hypothetical protein
MKRLIVGGALVAALAMPIGAVAQPSPSDEKNAAKECKKIRAAAGSEQNFREMFGGKRNAFGKCVSQRARQNEEQREGSPANASKACKAERAADPQAFKQKYRNHGQCVSSRVREQKQQEAAKDRNEQNAAKKCKAQRKADPQGFAQQWGTRRNAFGKCVSATARSQADQYVEQR